MTSIDWQAWKTTALQNELDNLYSRQDLGETSLLKDKKAVGFYVSFNRIFDHKGNLIKKKVKICTQGLSQKYGIDYQSIYSPTGKFRLLRCLLTIGALKDLNINHMDVVAAFLNPKLIDDSYMNIPPFIPKYQEEIVWKLRKPLYRLKQASRYWYLDISNYFKSIELNPSNSDPCLFISTDPDWECYLHVHIDDLKIVSNNVKQLKKLIEV
ncbi:hypothetical protein O181_086844 [Austropuccinia psidii MF-1]|uniref:Reverse transcriptase Ty1/copia-type domain-containing protein n=1 Tax=Austropuccinia psidii MF-1 TaxID=1389203 RepID=A0A9Q3P0I2_9BASI|nr:hypothetical protein [Austropuccinia psidii MF-1]